MANNIFGPHGPGINESTTRPEQTASGSGVDTFFAPCINGDPNTGTKISYRWLNFVTQNLRRAVRGMGVAENELDDDMILKAIQKADRTLVNLGHVDAKEVYAGLNGGGQHQIRKIKAGANITINLLEDGSIEIVGAASGGGGGGGGVGLFVGTPDAAVAYGGTFGTNFPSNPVAPHWVGATGGSGNYQIYANQWLKLDINCINANTLAASLTSGRVNVPVGTYAYDYAAWGTQCGNLTARLYNVTAAAVLHTTTTNFIANNNSAVVTGAGGSLVVAAPIVLEVQGFSAFNTASHTAAMGQASLRLTKLS